MQFLYLLSFNFIAAGNSETDSIFSQNLEFDLFEDANLEPTLSNKFGFAEINPIDQMTELNSNLFLADNTLVDPMVEPDLNSFFDDSVNLDSGSVDADYIACDVDIVDSNQLFDKKRSQTYCPPTLPLFVGQAVEPDEPTGYDNNDDIDTSNPNHPFDEIDPSTVFFKNLEVCPPKVFGTSNIPVCVRTTAEWVRGPRPSWVSIDNVGPRKSQSVLVFVVTANQICKAIVSSLPLVECFPSVIMWCCKTIVSLVCTSSS